MDIIESPRAMQEFSRQRHQKGKRIGFVPTMGFLHEGHLSLIRIARQSSDISVVSLFVNPTQFGPGEDLDAYPRDRDRDISLCRNEHVDVVYCPAPEAVYAEGHSVTVEETRFSQCLCGASRPGHFRGVTTIVLKLFNVVLPHVAVFGQKDAQQVRIIEKMVKDLDCPVEIAMGPIVREPDGVAMSSRNTYLSGPARRRAGSLHHALVLAEALIAEGQRDVPIICRRMREEIEAGGGDNPQSVNVEIDYIEAVDWETFEVVERLDKKALLALAVRLDETRLIDNVLIESSRLES